MTTSRLATAELALALGAVALAPAADWPQWGGGPTRNPVSAEKGLPLDFQFQLTEDGKVTQKERGIAWKAEVGRYSLAPPVVAGGLVWIVTRTNPPADERPDALGTNPDRALLKCFRESDGKLLWTYATPWLKDGRSLMRDVVGSCPLVEGDRLWFVDARSRVVCLDIGPLRKGTGSPTPIWELDLLKDFGVRPHFPPCPASYAGMASSVTAYKDRLYVVTHNGNNRETEVALEAPSLLCLDRATGKVVWKDNSPGKDILECQVSSPLVAEVNGKAQVIVGQGDGWLRAFDAATGKVVWKCDLNAKDAAPPTGVARNHMMATPILYDGRIYAATGQYDHLSPGPGCLYCIDPSKQGDVSHELEIEPKRGKPNPNSAVVWFTPPEVPEDAPRIEFGKKKKDFAPLTRPLLRPLRRRVRRP